MEIIPIEYQSTIKIQEHRYIQLQILRKKQKLH